MIIKQNLPNKHDCISGKYFSWVGLDQGELYKRFQQTETKGHFRVAFCLPSSRENVLLKSVARDKSSPSRSISNLSLPFFLYQYKQSGIESHLQVIHCRQDTYPGVLVLNKHKLNVLPLHFHFTQSLIRQRQAKKMIRWSEISTPSLLYFPIDLNS